MIHVKQLIEIYYRICMSLDDHCITTLILCDTSKAFDRVWHTGLLLKLKAYGVNYLNGLKVIFPVGNNVYL